MTYDVIAVKTAGGTEPGNGRLSFIEGGRDLPFEIKRMYWIYEVDGGAHRGFHAHKRNWQLLFCPYGSIDILLDDGTDRETVTLDSPSKGLILHPGLWREMIWKQSGSVLCVAASEYYDEQEYIRDYDQFLAYVREKK